jgi:integrase
MAELALNTGMRLELLALSWPTVDFSRRRLNVWRSLNNDGSLGSPKSSRHRNIPLNAQAKAALLAPRQLARR